MNSKPRAVPEGYQSVIPYFAIAEPGALLELREPTDECYGDRSAGVEASQGNQWWLASHIEDVSPEELAARARRARS